MRESASLVLSLAALRKRFKDEPEDFLDGIDRTSWETLAQHQPTQHEAVAKGAVAYQVQCTKPAETTRWSGDVIGRTGKKNFNAVSHKRAAFVVVSKLPAAFPKLSRSFRVYHISCYWMNIQVDSMSSNLASAMLNSKIRPCAVVGYGVKIFHPSPPNYITRSPGKCTACKSWSGRGSSAIVAAAPLSWPQLALHPDTSECVLVSAAISEPTPPVGQMMHEDCPLPLGRTHHKIIIL